jgi:hypothetical protein
VACTEIDYQETCAGIRALAEIRFKLLALLPAASGAAIAIVPRNMASDEAIALGSFGLAATLGLLVYDQRNTQFYNSLIGRARGLEEKLGFLSFTDVEHGGPYRDRPVDTRKLFGLLPMWHDLGLALVYSSCLAGWSFIVMQAIQTGQSYLVYAVPFAVAVAMMLGLLIPEVLRRRTRKDETLKDASGEAK